MPELEDDEARRNAANSGHQTLNDLLRGDRFREGVEAVLPPGMNAGRFFAILKRQISAVDNLALCTPHSILGSMTLCASLGLEPGLNGEAWLIPYNISKKDANDQWYKSLECSLQIGYLGHLAMAWRSEQISSVSCNYVMRGDHFRFQYGTSGYIEHIPKSDGSIDPKDLTHAYGLIETVYGGKIWRVLSRAEIERIRNSSPSKNSPAWANWFQEMAMAKALKSCLKLAPKTREMASAISADDLHDAGLAQNFELEVDVIPANLPRSEAQRQGDQMMADARKRNPTVAEGEGHSGDAVEQEREPVMAAARATPRVEPKEEPTPEPGELEDAPEESNPMGW